MMNRPCDYLNLDLARIVLPRLPNGSTASTGDGNCTFGLNPDQATPGPFGRIELSRQVANAPNFVAQAKQSFADQVASCTPSKNCDPSTMTTTPVVVGDQAVCFDTQRPAQGNSLYIKWQRAAAGFELDLSEPNGQATCGALTRLALALNAKL